MKDFYGFTFLLIIISGFCNGMRQNIWSNYGQSYDTSGPPQLIIPQPPPQPEPSIIFPGEVDYSGSYRNRAGVISSGRHYNGDNFGPNIFEDGPRPRNNDDARQTRCTGVCLHASQCASLGGTSSQVCPRGGANSVCCQFANSCNHVTTEVVSFFKSPGYPGPMIGNLICQYDVIIKSGTCAVKLEFLEFNTTVPLDRGLCNVDQLLVMNSEEGATFPRCGELTGYSTVVPTDARHKLPLTLLSIIQSSQEMFKYNIRVTQIKCGAPPRVKDYPLCGKTFMVDSDTPKKQSSGEEATTTVPSVDLDIENVVFDDTEQIYYANSKVDSRQNVDNVFYIAYLKQAYEAITNSSNNGGNSTLCKNKKEETTTVGPEKLRHASSGSVFEEEELGRIIRGDEAFVNEFPWQVSIQDDKGHVCGGAIISPVSILTAAHCYMSIAPVPIQTLKVIVGDLNFNSTTEAIDERVSVSSVVFHSHFDPYYLENDICLIKLKHPVTFRAGVQPVCLPERGNSYTGQSAVISGWGATTYPHGKLATYLQKSSNRIIENAECKKKLKIEYLYDTMICAVAPNCSGTCFGDSGSGLIFKGDEGRNTLIGLVSFGIGGCALFPYWPDVYTRVTSFLDWLDYASF